MWKPNHQAASLKECEVLVKCRKGGLGNPFLKCGWLYQVIQMPSVGCMLGTGGPVQSHYINFQCSQYFCNFSSTLTYNISAISGHHFPVCDHGTLPCMVRTHRLPHTKISLSLSLSLYISMAYLLTVLILIPRATRMKIDWAQGMLYLCNIIRVSAIDGVLNACPSTGSDVT